jgi:hypothetical protein
MSKARTYLSAATLKFRPLTLPINIRQGERPDRDKHSSLFRTFVNYGGKSFITLSLDDYMTGRVLQKKLQYFDVTWGLYYKTFTDVIYGFLY